MCALLFFLFLVIRVASLDLDAIHEWKGQIGGTCELAQGGGGHNTALTHEAPQKGSAVGQ